MFQLYCVLIQFDIFIVLSNDYVGELKVCIKTYKRANDTSRTISGLVTQARTISGIVI